MAYTHQVRHELTAPGGGFSKLNSYSSEGRSAISVTVPGSSTNYNIAGTLDVSQLKSLAILASVAATLKTNSSGSPTNTITLVPGVPYMWTTDSYDTCKITGDITTMYLTVPGAVDCDFIFDAIYDATP